MKLEPHGVGCERPASQPCPLDRALALLDPLLACATLVVERDDPLGRTAHVRHNEADTGIKLSRVPLYLGDYPARLAPVRRDDQTLTAAANPDGTAERGSLARSKAARGL